MFFWVWSYNTDSIQSGRLNDKPNIDMGKNLVNKNDSVIQIHWHPSWWPNSVDWKIWILATWNDMNSNFSCILGNLWKIGIHFDKIYSFNQVFIISFHVQHQLFYLKGNILYIRFYQKNYRPDNYISMGYIYMHTTQFLLHKQ